MALSTVRKPNPESYLPPGGLAGDDNFATRPADANSRHVPPPSSFYSGSTGKIILGVLVVVALIAAVTYGTSDRATTPAISDSTVTQPVQPDNPPVLPDATGQSQTTAPQTTAPVTPAPAPTAEQPVAPEPTTPPVQTAPPVQTQPAQPGTGTTVQ